MERFRDFGERGLRGGLSQLGDFRKFILRGNVVDLAVGIVIGAAFSAVVTSFVNNVISPLIPAPGGNLFTWSYPILYTGKPLQLGVFVSAVISFLIIAAVVYFFVVKPVNVLTDRFTPHKDTIPTTRECPFCLSTVPLKATRCAYCTAQLPPADTVTTGVGR
ncbi:MAG: large conductance mechanosensitive channel protein MscL [Ktedonobacteraceae bacterium]